MEESRAFQFSLIRAIFDVSLDGILVSDNTDRMFGCNKRLSETLEIRVPDILPGPVAEGSMGTHRDLLARCADLVNDPEELERRVEEICNDPDINDKTQIELKDGRTLERFTSSLRDKSGEYLGRVWFFRDISERKIAQQKLHDAYKAVEALAATDSLTGIANRRRFDQVLNTEWRRGLRDRSSLSLLMIDVDLFKSYNDEYGHPQGDTCLKQIAEVIQNAIARPGDMVARFGGEEFTVILPRTDRAGALNLAMEICEAMRGRKIRHEDNPAGAVTLSVGCATMLPAFGEHAVGLIELADEALYEAKHRGRNQVCASEARAEGATEFPPPGVTDSNIGHFA
jgi:diguanylate cyclase (GGDEF)-like protein